MHMKAARDSSVMLIIFVVITVIIQCGRLFLFYFDGFTLNVADVIDLLCIYV